jgi:hypothetical protein
MFDLECWYFSPKDQSFKIKIGDQSLYFPDFDHLSDMRQQKISFLCVLELQLDASRLHTFEERMQRIRKFFVRDMLQHYVVPKVYINRNLCFVYFLNKSKRIVLHSSYFFVYFTIYFGYEVVGALFKYFLVALRPYIQVDLFKLAGYVVSKAFESILVHCPSNLGKDTFFIESY